MAVSRFRRLVPQVLGSFACGLMLLDLCMSLGYSTIIIAQLSKSQEIPLSEYHASWLGSIAYICQPIGSLSSGVLVEWLGRKRLMLLLNVPFLAWWLLTSFAPNYGLLVLANVIAGVTIGLTEAPINCYIGEICQPEIRGAMTACGAIFANFGFFLEDVVGLVASWRVTAGVSAAIPFFTAIYLCLIPEAPIWLVSKGRVAEAEKALCWLRGWVEPSMVKQELAELVRYHEETKLTPPARATFSNPAFVGDGGEKGAPATEAKDPPRVIDTSWCTEMTNRVRDLVKPATLRPLMLVIPLFFFAFFSGLANMRPFMVHVFDEFHMPISGERAAVVSASCGMLGTLFMTLSVHSIGKRPLSLICTAGSALATFLLGVYALLEPSLPWVPLTLFIALSLLNGMLSQIPWMLMSEVFPFRTRGISSGLSAASCYVILFLGTKTYLDIEHSFHLYGAFFFFGAISTVGVVFLYFRMLETEGKTLEDIEEHFALGRSALSATNKG